ncbi:ABC transporter permease [Crossiella cryophila]|uniref:Ribose transport system permease protein n=1 Tax=Crossiella cryophila TaxID=43355 RepID=A0A7W7C9L3_9PSEU|nr:ABC transporter permease [Crossiella cryophila]MBB4677083.1 ribose transport system permease protein [Crossiella cryophila]
MKTDVPTTGPTAPDRSRSKVLGQVLGEAGIGVALLVLVLVFLAFAPQFGTGQNIRNIMTQITLNTILAVGMTFVVLVGGIDLSVGSVLALSAVVAGSLMTWDALSPGTGLLLGVLAAVLVGALCGLVNGAVTERWKVPSFIITLGMLYVARGAAQEYTNAQTIYNLPRELTLFGTATFLGLPAVFVVALALVALGWFVLSRTVFGRLVYAVGTNEEAVRLAGHRTGWVKVSVFVIAGVCVGIAAVVYMARLNIASPILGNGYELNAIAAVVIGGASLTGGRGSMIGTLLGACLLGVLSNGLILLGVSDFQRTMITGGVIIVAVVLDAYRRRVATRLNSVITV